MMEGMPLAPRSRPLVGRDTELERLRRAGGVTDPDLGGGVLVSGDAGIGKSRLVAELAATAEDAGRLVVAGHCVGAGGAALAWLPFVEVVGQIARSTGALEETIRRHDALAAVQPGGTPEALDADPGRIAEAVHALLTTAAGERPLLVVIEDVHWADHSSRDLLTLLLTRGFSAPVTLVVTYRRDDLHRTHPLQEVLAVWTRLPLVTRIDLEPLGPAQMRRLVTDLEQAPTATREVSAIVEKADGNPFFAEELVAGGDSSVVGHDLARLLRLRLDRLGEDARTLVRAASLAGRSVEPDVLAAVTGLSPDALDEALREAIDHQILQPAGQGGFGFRHPLIGETVAQELLPGARRHLHTAWLGALESHPEAAAPADTARHAAATGDLETAARAAVAAGDEAMRVGGSRDALRLYEAALGWMPPDPERRGQAALRAARAAKAAGDQLRSLDLLEEALRELDDGDEEGAGVDPRLRAELLGRAAVWYTVLDVPGDPLGMSNRAVALLPGWDQPSDFAVLMRHLDVLVNLELEAEGTALIDRIVARAEELDLPEVVAASRLHEARLLSRADPDNSRASLLATATDTDAPGSLRLPALLRLGTLERNRGDVRAAYGHYATGVEVADRRRRRWGPYGMECRVHAGRAAYELGLWDEAERLLSSPADLPHPPKGFMDGALVELLVARGDHIEPDRLADTEQWWEVDVLLVVAMLGGQIDLLGRAGMVEEMTDLVHRGIETIERRWGSEAQAVVRLAALFVGQVADLVGDGRGAEAAGGGRDAHSRDMTLARARCEEYAEMVAALGAREDVRIGPESRAWLDRHRAEGLRLAAAVGEGPDPEALVDAWQRAAAGFAALPNRPEEARSLARLAEVLTRVGRRGEATEVADRARALATELGARPVLALLDALTAAGEGRGTADQEPGALTPRELEVLEHVALGRTNGQVASLLFISRKTVSVHVSNILAKLGATTRGEASAVARRQGLIGPDS